MSIAIRMEAVQKRYGRLQALDGMSLQVPVGSICGFVGPNGAGKTTTMAILSGFLHQDAGVVDILGAGPFNPAIHQGRVGILPQDAELPPASSPRQLLQAWGGIQGLKGQGLRDAVANVLATVQLSDRIDQPIKNLSHGMRRRVTVASALLGDPELILLDEPTSGLDPLQAAHLRGCIAALRGKRTVLVSSHNLQELESLCDHMIFVEKGRCTRQGPLSTITGADREVRIHLAEPLPPGRAAEVLLTLAPQDPRSLAQATTDLLRQLLAEGALIQDVQRGESLERRYLLGTTLGNTP